MNGSHWRVPFECLPSSLDDRAHRAALLDGHFLERAFEVFLAHLRVVGRRGAILAQQHQLAVAQRFASAARNGIDDVRAARETGGTRTCRCRLRSRCPVSFTLTLTGSFAAPGRATTSNGPLPVASPGGSACAVHFSEPSGQYASGQLCSGCSFWSAPRNAKFLASRCLPRGHGVPQVTPCATAAALPSSQRTQAPAPGFGVE